jgi:uncharacterized protein YndB with AHSA1/START domain
MTVVAKDNEARATADREIVVTRVFDAPRELVFKAWIDERNIGQWWGPNGFTITTHEMDVRVGGTWRFVMHGPEGVDYDNKIVYLEIVEPVRLVYIHGDDGETGQFRTTVMFEELDGKTRLTMQALFASAAERDRVVKEFGVIEGANQTLDRLGAYLAQM